MADASAAMPSVLAADESTAAGKKPKTEKPKGKKVKVGKKKCEPKGKKVKVGKKIATKGIKLKVAKTGKAKGKTSEVAATTVTKDNEPEREPKAPKKLPKQGEGSDKEKEKKLTGHKARIVALTIFLADVHQDEFQGEATSDQPPKKRKGMKRPAAASSTGDGPEDEDTCSQDTGRNRMKQYYMLQCVDQLPEEARKLFEEARRCGHRREQTKMINGIMKKKGSGQGYEIDFSAPIFEELRTKFERKYASERDKGMTREQMEALLGGAEKFEVAVARGAVKRTEGRDGAEYWVIRQLEAGTETGT